MLSEAKSYDQFKLKAVGVGYGSSLRYLERVAQYLFDGHTQR
jgi:hypothetical protein